jgi:hypothetical protein
MEDTGEHTIKGGGIYKSQNVDGDNSNFIVTAIGLNHVLFADYPMIRFNGSYLEYCVTKKEFYRKFTALSNEAA